MPELIDVMYGSFVVPGYFAPEAADGTDYFDGSTIMNLDVFSAVNQCLDQGFAIEDVVIDVVMTNSKNLKTVDASNYKSIEMLWRFLEVERYYSVMDGLLRAQFAYPTAQWRHIISPSLEMPDTRFPLNWTADQVTSAINIGITDGINALGSAEDTLEYFALKKKRDQRIKGVTFEQFVESKAAGEIESFNHLEDAKLQALFLQ